MGAQSNQAVVPLTCDEKFGLIVCLYTNEKKNFFQCTPIVDRFRGRKSDENRVQTKSRIYESSRIIITCIWARAHDRRRRYFSRGARGPPVAVPPPPPPPLPQCRHVTRTTRCSSLARVVRIRRRCAADVVCAGRFRMRLQNVRSVPRFTRCKTRVAPYGKS